MEAKDLLAVAKKGRSLGYKSFVERKTPELVFVFVEPIGGGAVQAVEELKRKLKSPRFDYKIHEISLSKELDVEAKAQGIPEPPLHEMLENLHPNISLEAKRINRLQQLGNTLRDRRGNDFLARVAINRIAEYRMKHGMEQAQGGVPVPKPLRVAHVIKSIKHKEELTLLKAVYGELLTLIAVSGDHDQQVHNFHPEANTQEQNKRLRKEYEVLSAIDQDEGIDNGQQVRDIFYRANLFLNNDRASIDQSLTTFLDLLFGIKISSPSIDERMMFEAFSASWRSTCLSRQVGAAISDESGELVSIGWNDIPFFGGGLATDFEGKGKDALCKSKGRCRSSEEIEKMLKNMYERLQDADLILKKASFKKVKAVLKKAGVSELIEFSRAIHAEMEALLSAARTAKAGISGGTIYVTTYPCENCAKHLITAGIKKIVYIEPYPKSRVLAFFSDFIAEDNKPAGENQVSVSQFVGISHESYPLLFKKRFARKGKDGRCIDSGEKPIPITNVYLDSYTLYESSIAQEVSDESKGSAATSN
ncbi:anti-phage dCTP deaminase [Pseudodesulfovibrio indicus]|uniref:Deoxycytidylate deaminase n=1 Tax=Pseudodesulfovibrio indicus TaxID=1716143 RepID=A0AA94TIU2_9BACT|nr:anti-phage dCTP deaminase [Pseudodesulfovibrio indicus]TDT82039.1 deoxycytidylate deaminase [Pseudodesulfovibrio indicus]